LTIYEVIPLEIDHSPKKWEDRPKIKRGKGWGRWKHGSLDLDDGSEGCNSPVGVGFSPEGKAHLMRCKKHKVCKWCARVKRDNDVKRILSAFRGHLEANLTLGFVTLTVRWSTEEEKEYINSMFSTFWGRFRSTFWKALRFDYCKVIEYTKEKVKHIHLITYPVLQHVDVEEAWIQASGSDSFMVEVQPVQSIRSLSCYLAKYMSKVDYSLFKPHERVIEFSRSLRVPVDLELYELVRVPVMEVVGYVDRYGVSCGESFMSRPVRKPRVKRNGEIQYTSYKRLRKPWVIERCKISREWFVLNRKKLEDEFRLGFSMVLSWLRGGGAGSEKFGDLLESLGVDKWLDWFDMAMIKHDIRKPRAISGIPISKIDELHWRFLNE